MQTRSTLCGAAIMAIAVLCAASASAQAPANEQIRFQGRLLDSASNPITTTTSVEFNIYTGPTGGTSQWTETHNITPSANGVFTVLFGTQTDFTGVDFSQAVYVGVTVDTDPEMTPRYLLSSGSVAHFAKDADTVDGLDSSSFAQLTAGAITFTGDITANSYTGDGSGLTSLDASQLTGTVPMAALNATSANTPNTLVLRDANGGFSAGPSLFHNPGGVGLVVSTGAGQALDVQGSATILGSLDTGGPITATAPITTSGPLTVNTAPALLNGGLIVSNTAATINAGLTVSGGPTALTVNGLSSFNAPITANAGLTSNAPITSNVAPITLGQQSNTSPVPLLFHDSSAATNESGALLAPAAFTAFRSWFLPDADGTIALLSDITGGTQTGTFSSLNVSGTGAFGGLLSANGALTVSGGPTALTVNGLSSFNAPISVTGGVTCQGPINSPTAPITIGQQGNASPTPLLLHDADNATVVSGALLAPLSLTAARTWFMPDADGTVALVSDITGGGTAGNFSSVTATSLTVGTGGPQIRSGTADPSAGTGLTAPVGSLFLRDNAGVGELWLKTGAADTAWTMK